MNDNQLRAATMRKVIPKYLRHPDSMVIQEMNLRHAAARIDIAVVGDTLHGFELKSDADTLDRLPDQARVYSAVFDRMTLIVGYAHAYEALQLIPSWWGVKLAHVGPRGAIHISDARSGRNNPSMDPIAVASLLLRPEALGVLEDLGKADGFRSKPASVIYRSVARWMSPDEVCRRVRQQIICRRRVQQSA